MEEYLKIGIFQYNIYWENIEKNQNKIRERLNSLKSIPDIFILPEMYATGFSMHPEVLSSEEIRSQVEWQKSLSKEYKVGIMGSTIYLENDSYLNRVLFTTPDKDLITYDKRHLFQMEKDNNSFKCGIERVCFEFKGVKIMPLICYDLRFPVWSRNDFGYHISIYVANWPANRSGIWDTLLKARAIENQCYTIGVNRVGIDGNSINYEGRSAVYGAKGETLLLMNEDEGYSEINLPIKELIKFREKFGAYKDADSFEIKNREL